MNSCQTCPVNCKGNLIHHLANQMDSIDRSRRLFKMRKNQILLTVGQPMGGWYCIRKGKIRTYKISRSGKEQTYRIIGPGDWIGYREMMNGGESLLNAISISDSELCFIPSKLWSPILDNTQFLQSLVARLTDELKRSEDMVFSLGTKKLHSRLAELLLQISDEEDSTSITLTRELMSTMMGATTESIVRALTDFKDRNWVLVERNCIQLLDKNALKELAQIDPS